MAKSAVAPLPAASVAAFGVSWSSANDPMQPVTRLEDNVRFQLPSKRVIFIALKILLGAATALVAILSGKGTCPPNLYCIDLGYFMPINPFTVSMILIAMVSLTSAFIDIFENLATIDIGQRNIESIAHLEDGDS